jgi:hypothetical protein
MGIREIILVYQRHLGSPRINAIAQNLKNTYQSIAVTLRASKL